MLTVYEDVAALALVPVDDVLDTDFPDVGEVEAEAEFDVTGNAGA
jgi:hypothetical protein